MGGGGGCNTRAEEDNWIKGSSVSQGGSGGVR